MADDEPACDGKVIACLQWHATEGIHKQGVPKVSEKCRRELDPISEQQAMDYRYSLTYVYSFTRLLSMYVCYKNKEVLQV